MYKYVKTLPVILLATSLPLMAAESAVTTSPNDPMVMKVYPDGTKVVVRWSEIGKSVDNGATHGGAPRIIAYEPGKDGIVPIGATNAPSTTSAPKSNPSPMSDANSKSSDVNSSYVVSPSDNNRIVSDEMSGFYCAPELGVAFNSNLNFKSVSGDIALPFGYEVTGTATTSMSVNPGIRFNFAMGYRPVEWFAIEFAPGIIWNSLNTLTTSYQGSLYDPDGQLVGQESGSFALVTKGGYYQVPLVINAIFRIPTDTPFIPYFGGGIGASYSYMNITQFSYAPLSVTENISSTDGSCWSLAYQAIAGFDYQIDENVSLGLKYIFTGTGNQNFGGDLQGLKSKGSISQSALVNCTISF